MTARSQVRMFVETNLDIINFKLALDNHRFELTLDDISKLSDQELGELMRRLEITQRNI